MKEMKNIEAIILDVDGCIVGEKIGFNSPDPNEKVVDVMKKLSIPVILCTAKPHFSIRNIINDCEFNNYHITDGGSVLINPIKDEFIKKYIIDVEMAKKVVRAYLDNNIYVELYTTDDYIIQKDMVSDITPKHRHILQREPKIVDDLVLECDNGGITKIMPIALNEEDKESLEKVFNDLKTDLTLSWGIHPVALPLQFGIITAPLISKKQGAIDILNKMGISFEKTLGIGDSKSDWQFIGMCKYGATLDNGNEALKELLKKKGENSFITDKSVDENGIIDIIEHFINKR